MSSFSQRRQRDRERKRRERRTERANCNLERAKAESSRPRQSPLLHCPYSSDEEEQEKEEHRASRKRPSSSITATSLFSKEFSPLPAEKPSKSGYSSSSEDDSRDFVVRRDLQSSARKYEYLTSPQKHCSSFTSDRSTSSFGNPNAMQLSPHSNSQPKESSLSHMNKRGASGAPTTHFPYMRSGYSSSEDSDTGAVTSQVGRWKIDDPGSNEGDEADEAFDSRSTATKNSPCKQSQHTTHVHAKSSDDPCTESDTQMEIRLQNDAIVHRPNQASGYSSSSEESCTPTVAKRWARQASNCEKKMSKQHGAAADDDSSDNSEDYRNDLLNLIRFNSSKPTHRPPSSVPVSSHRGSLHGQLKVNDHHRDGGATTKNENYQGSDLVRAKGDSKTFCEIDASKLKVSSESFCEQAEELLYRQRRISGESGLSTGVDQGQEVATFDDGLKPTFDSPRFGPFALQPLVLDESDYKVPAAIARYLPDFQRKGIQFVHKTLTEHGGAILGDDMGLGKTMQTIALLAAYLEKMGTNEDLHIVRRKKRELEMYEQARRNMEEEELSYGRVLLDKEIKQPLSFIAQRAAPVLIIMPKGVFNNWHVELEAWGHFAVAEYRGKHRENELSRALNNTAEIVLCPESLLNRAEDLKLLLKVPWKLVVVDEYHHFKNEKGKLSQHLRLVRNESGCKLLGLTGTLMQNNYSEPWNLVDMVKPNLLGGYKIFQEDYEFPILLGRSKCASAAEIKTGHEQSIKLNSLIQSIYMGRNKENVLKGYLPKKEELVVMCELSPIQKKVYRHLLTLPDFTVLLEAGGPCDCGVNRKFFVEYQQMQQSNTTTRQDLVDYVRNNKGAITTRAKCCYKFPASNRGSSDIHQLAVLWRQVHPDGICEHVNPRTKKPSKPFCFAFSPMHVLYKLCSHVSLLQMEKHPDQCLSDKDRKEAENMLERAELFLPPNIRDELPGGLYQKLMLDNDHHALSGKIKQLELLLKNISARQGRVLLFSASTQSLDLIQNYIKSKGYSCCRMDGETPADKRTELAAKFNNTPSLFIFLLSTKANAVGLNLTGANNVIIFDVSWNPADDQQAQDRAYRIGQSDDVTVYRLVSRGTIEEQKYLRQIYKGDLKDEILFDPCCLSCATDKKRSFRGVQNSPHLTGELFGFPNLMQFKDGEFLKYEKVTTRGITVVKSAFITDKIQQMNEESMNNLAGDVTIEGFDKFAAIDLKGDPRTQKSDDESDDQSSHLGANSQVMLSIFERAMLSSDDDSTIPDYQQNIDYCTGIGDRSMQDKCDDHSTGMTKSTSFVEPEHPLSSDAKQHELSLPPMSSIPDMVVSFPTYSTKGEPDAPIKSLSFVPEAASSHSASEQGLTDMQVPVRGSPVCPDNVGSYYLSTDDMLDFRRPVFDHVDDLDTVPDTPTKSTLIHSPTGELKAEKSPQGVCDGYREATLMSDTIPPKSLHTAATPDTPGSGSILGVVLKPEEVNLGETTKKRQVLDREDSESPRGGAKHQKVGAL